MTELDYPMPGGPSSPGDQKKGFTARQPDSLNCSPESEVHTTAAYPGVEFWPCSAPDPYNDDASNDVERPVTSDRLAELDIPRIIDNPKLRHDVNFDRELHFRPKLDGVQGMNKWGEVDPPGYLGVLNARLANVREAISALSLRFEEHYTSDNRIDLLRKGTEAMEKEAVGKTTRYDSVTRGRLLGKSHTALVDTCAENFVSNAIVTDKNTIETSERRKICRADGSAFWTLGSVSLPWKFKGEKEKHLVQFSVLPARYCQYAVTLGGRFMKQTKSLTDFAHRITRQARTLLSPCVRYQGSGQLRMEGLYESYQVSALPDSASDVPLISPQFAKLIKKPIDRGTASCIDLILPGHRKARTTGLVRNVQLSFGGATHTLDLYVLPGLPGDILLDAEFLHSTNAFKRYENVTYDIDDGLDDETLGIFLTIQRASKKAKKLTAIEQIEKDFREAESSLVAKRKTVKHSDLPPAEKEVAIQLLDDEYHALEQKKRDAVEALKNPASPGPPLGQGGPGTTMHVGHP